MKRIVAFIMLLNSVFVFGQIQDAWIYFTDKPNAEFYLNNPLEMLSQRALDRRVNQNISLNLTDVPVHQAYINAIIDLQTVEVKATSKWMNAIHIRGSYDDITALNSLLFVQSIEFADKSLNLEPRSSANNIVLSNQKNLNTTEDYPYGDSSNQIELHNGHLLHQQHFTGNGKIIAVMDNGFIGVDNALPFQRLHTENLILGGYDFVNRNPNYYSGGNHGTRVLSTIGGYQENSLIGTAPNAQFYLFITEDNTSETPLEESLWVEAAEIADSLGVDIINTSLGYNYFDNPNYNYTYQDLDGNTTFISRGANMAYAKGIICVTSAGNAGNGSWQYITAPADAPGSFTIGAINSSGNYASFSSIGPTADARIKPDVMAQGVAAITSDQNGNIAGVNGTSFSSPIMAGLIACLWEAFPTLTNEELMQLVRESAHLYNNPTDQMGYGIPDFYAISQSLKNDSLSLDQLFLYPNPTSDFLYFYSTNSQESKLKIFDVSGKIILEKPIQNNIKIDAQHLQNGMYFYQIQSEGLTKKGKFIKG